MTANKMEWQLNFDQCSKCTVGKYGFRYSSDTNTWWLRDDEMRQLIADVQNDPAIQDKPSPTEPRLIVGG